MTSLPNQPVVVRQLGEADYAATLTRMREFTEARTLETADEIWQLEHPPVFTLGTNADPAHILAAGDIPVVQVDRGGQVTYHGPGQLVTYVLLDLKRARLGIRDLVCRLERSAIATLAAYDIRATGDRDAPGIYVNGVKIGSIGLRVRRNCCYHGIALNVNADLEPFGRINPCGYEGLTVTSIEKLGGPDNVAAVSKDFLLQIFRELNLEPIDD